MKRWLLIGIAIVIIIIASLFVSNVYSEHIYKAPTSSVFPGATARCKDGVISYSTGRGTCSTHGGVGERL